MARGDEKQLDNVGLAIKQIRLRDNIPEKVFAKSIGVSLEALHDIESGERVPNSTTLQLINRKYSTTKKESQTLTRAAQSEERIETVSTKRKPSVYLAMPYQKMEKEYHGVKNALGEHGCDVIYPRYNSEPGLDWEKEIYSAIRNVDVFLLILGNESQAASEFEMTALFKETARAFEENIRVEAYHHLDFSKVSPSLSGKTLSNSESTELFDLLANSQCTRYVWEKNDSLLNQVNELARELIVTMYDSNSDKGISQSIQADNVSRRTLKTENLSTADSQFETTADKSGPPKVGTGEDFVEPASIDTSAANNAFSAKVIRGIRDRLDLNNTKMANLLEVTSDSISKWLREENHPKVDSVLRLRTLPGLTESELSDLDAIQENAREVQTNSNKETGSPLGTHSEVTRNSTENCLDVEIYANALVQHFRNTTGDFCFGVLGAWGRGKTHLMKLVSKQLRTDKKEDKYDTVNFSAWKFRTTPEVWVHLYETLRSAALSETIDDGDTSETKKLSWWKQIPIIVRFGIVRHGFWPLCWAIILFGAALIPLGDKAVSWDDGSWAQWFVPGGISAAGLLLLANMMKGMSKAKSALGERYSKIADHKEKLGLQAAIGDDIEALLRAWMPYNPKTPQDCFGEHAGKIAGLFLSTFFVMGVLLWQFAWIDGDLRPERLTRWQEFLISTPYILAFVFAPWVALGERKTKKILLVVDDLDRCETGQVIEIMECLILMLEDDALSRRVQLVMLVEDKALAHAIEHKFESLIEYKIRLHKTGKEASENEINFVRRNVVREHTQKLFLTHLKLPELRENEVGEITKAYVKETRPKETQEKYAEQEILEKEEEKKRKNEERKNMRERHENERSEEEKTRKERQLEIDTATKELNDLAKIKDGKGEGKIIPQTHQKNLQGMVDLLKGQSIFDKQTHERQEEKRAQESAELAGENPKASFGTELDAIPDSATETGITPYEAKKLQEAIDSDGHDIEWGPRRIRSFLLKYQLARLILQELGQFDGADSSVDRVVQEFEIQLLLDGDPSADNDKTIQAIANVVQQVI